MEGLDTEHVIRVTAIKIRGTLFVGMLFTENRLCFNGTVPGFFLISFEDDKRRPLGAAATVALGRRVRNFVSGSVLVVYLLLSSVLSVCQPYVLGKQAE
ncbi:MAG: hypothetical protein R6U53_08785 [Natronomonas sp.]